MTSIADRVHRGLIIAGAILVSGSLMLLSFLPTVPTEAAAMTAWVDEGRSLLSWSDELLFFAIICWGAGARGLLRTNDNASSSRMNVGVIALATSLVALIVLLLALGRAVYPVFGIELAGDALALVISSSFGAVHLALLGFAVAAVALSWSTRAGLAGRLMGILAGAIFGIGSFPWLIPDWGNSGVAIAVGAWGVFLAVATHSGNLHAGISALDE